MEKHWHAEAFDMFFKNHASISAISHQTGISRRTITLFLQNCEQFTSEREYRKKKHADSRKMLKREQSKEYRIDNKRKELRETVELQGHLKISGNSLLSEHEEAVRTLSYERIYDNFTEDGGYL